MAWKSGISAIERAFQIAASGRVKDMQELRAVLNREGYDLSQLQGPSLLKQLRDAIRIAWTRPVRSAPPLREGS